MSALPGVNVCLMGGSGTGKTYSIGTLVDAGIETFYLGFESGAESLLGYWTDRGKAVPPSLHISTVKTASAGWKEMADAAKLVNTLSYESLKKASDPNRSKYDQFERFLRAFGDVTDDEGRHFGPADDFDTKRAIVVDGLTGLGVAAMAAVIGGKVDRDQKDWGLAQNLVEGTIRRLCDSCQCHFVLIAHVEREPDPLGGTSKITVSTLGRALAPKIPAMFSDVILTQRLGKEFYWDTENPMADVKSRNLPIAAKNPPNFGLILDRWKSRGGV